MTTAPWNGVVLAESDKTLVVGDNHDLALDAVAPRTGPAARGIAGRVALRRVVAVERVESAGSESAARGGARQAPPMKGSAILAPAMAGRHQEVDHPAQRPWAIDAPVRDRSDDRSSGER